MRPRATATLANLPTSEFLARVSEGLTLIAEHMLELEGAAESYLGGAAARASAAIRVVADEEAAKYLILLDAARSVRADKRLKVRQLKRFHNHIAKGIYAELCEMRPADFAEVISYVRTLRRSHYLDGPNEVDWIFRNEIEAKREERLYVDYVETDEGAQWLSPGRYDRMGSGSGSAVTTLVWALHVAGASTKVGARTISEIWNDFVPEPSTRWTSVEQLNSLTLSRLPGTEIGELSEGERRAILDTWTFPLHSIDLEVIMVDQEELRRQQAERIAANNRTEPPDPA